MVDVSTDGTPRFHTSFYTPLPLGIASDNAYDPAFFRYALMRTTLKVQHNVFLRQDSTFFFRCVSVLLLLLLLRLEEVVVTADDAYFAYVYALSGSVRVAKDLIDKTVKAN